MGGGNWTSDAYERKIRSMGFSSSDDMMRSNVRQVYRQTKLADSLNPKNVIRECKDSEEHPNTFPIILGLDVTGSMGKATKMCAAKLDEIMKELYGKVPDIEFMMMGIGDVNYDEAPIQVTQFESDIRILDQTSKIWFEGGGGGNDSESYTAAWYFGTYRTELDCWNRGKKGLIITMGDEPLNMYLPEVELNNVIGGESCPNALSTDKLYETASDKFNIYHIAIADRESSYAMFKRRIEDTWGRVLRQHFLTGTSEELPSLIGKIVDSHLESFERETVCSTGMIGW